MDRLLSFFQGMEWPTLLMGALLGCLIPSVLKFLISLFKVKKEKYHISLVSNKESSSFSSFERDDLSVSIKYKGESFDGSLTIIEIGLINDGLSDIGFAQHFDSPIVLKSAAYKIIDAQYLGDPSIKATVSLDDNGSVGIQWRILKKGEKIIIRLVGVYSCSKEKGKNSILSFYDSLSFKVRSDCVDYILPRRIPFKLYAVTTFLCCMLTGFLQYSSEKKDMFGNDYSFSYKNDCILGHLDFEKESNTYVIIPRDSMRPSSRLLDFKKYPVVSIKEVRKPGVRMLMVYSAIWCFLLLFYALIAGITNSVTNNKKTFEA